MRVYAGHQLDNPEGRFFVFAETKQAALAFLAEEDIEVAPQSVIPVHDSGAVLFRSRPGRGPGEVEDLRFDGELPDWEDCEEEAA